MNSPARIGALWQPVRLPMVGRHLGQLALVLGFLLLVPASFALASQDWRLAFWLGLGGLTPALALATLARIPPARSPLQANEALVVAALAFILAAALATPALVAGGLAPLDAWFEAVSGISTTGLSMVPDPAGHSPAFLFTRGWIQWFGGLGIVVLSLALAFGRVADMRRLADPTQEEEDIGAGIRLQARRVSLVYPLLTLAVAAAAWAAGLPPFQALIHTLSAVSTGGFSGFADSLAGMGPAPRSVLLAGCFLGALPLLLFYRGYARGWSQIARDPELEALIVAILLAACGLSLLGQVATPDALAQAVSAQTGAGFSTLDPGALDPAAKWVLIVSMAIGGSAGSTAGGFKLLRVLILLRVIQTSLLRVQMPRHAVLDPELGGHPLRPEHIQQAFVVVALFVLVILFSWLPFLAAGYPPLDALFEVVSATATVGLSTGITNPDLAPGLKALLTLDMLAGRVEVVALLVLLYPGTWRKPH